MSVFDAVVQQRESAIQEELEEQNRRNEKFRQAQTAFKTTCDELFAKLTTIQADLVESAQRFGMKAESERNKIHPHRIVLKILPEAPSDSVEAKKRDFWASFLVRTDNLNYLVEVEAKVDVRGYGNTPVIEWKRAIHINEASEDLFKELLKRFLNEMFDSRKILLTRAQEAALNPAGISSRRS